MVFDCRFLPNPHWDPELRPMTGLDADVQDYVTGYAPGRAGSWNGLEDLLAFLVPAFDADGKSVLTVAFGCTGGHHRSVTMAEQFADVAAVTRAGRRRSATGTSNGERRPARRSVVASAVATAWPRPSGPCACSPVDPVAVVSVADDGGSTGRLRADSDRAAPGDLRKCLVALAGEPTPAGPGSWSTGSRPASSRGTPSAT